jgi:copper chaperone CopZ
MASHRDSRVTLTDDSSQVDVNTIAEAVHDAGYAVSG